MSCGFYCTRNKNVSDVAKRLDSEIRGLNPKVSLNLRATDATRDRTARGHLTHITALCAKKFRIRESELIEAFWKELACLPSSKPELLESWMKLNLAIEIPHQWLSRIEDFMEYMCGLDVDRSCSSKDATITAQPAAKDAAAAATSAVGNSTENILHAEPSDHCWVQSCNGPAHFSAQDKSARCHANSKCKPRDVLRGVHDRWPKTDRKHYLCCAKKCFHRWNYSEHRSWCGFYCTPGGNLSVLAMNLNNHLREKSDRTIQTARIHLINAITNLQGPSSRIRNRQMLSWHRQHGDGEFIGVFWKELVCLPVDLNPDRRQESLQEWIWYNTDIPIEWLTRIEDFLSCACSLKVDRSHPPSTFQAAASLSARDVPQLNKTADVAYSLDSHTPETNQSSSALMLHITPSSNPAAAPQPSVRNGFAEDDADDHSPQPKNAANKKPKRQDGSSKADIESTSAPVPQTASSATGSSKIAEVAQSTSKETTHDQRVSSKSQNLEFSRTLREQMNEEGISDQELLDDVWLTRFSKLKDLDQHITVGLNTVRSNQRQFRQQVFEDCNSQCVLTKIFQPCIVLQAAHLVPVELVLKFARECRDEKDQPVNVSQIMDRNNGIVLRADLHILFDFCEKSNDSTLPQISLIDFSFEERISTFHNLQHLMDSGTVILHLHESVNYLNPSSSDIKAIFTPARKKFLFWRLQLSSRASASDFSSKVSTRSRKKKKNEANPNSGIFRSHNPFP